MKQTAALDPNHTHFILVDNGKQQEFGGEIDLRSRLEEHVSTKLQKVGGQSTPHYFPLSLYWLLYEF